MPLLVIPDSVVNMKMGGMLGPGTRSGNGRVPIMPTCQRSPPLPVVLPSIMGMVGVGTPIANSINHHKNDSHGDADKGRAVAKPTSSEREP